MIRVLPSNISNLIAAGEVVSRPASVVKELMENSIDAGATSVSVVVLDAGKTLLQVIDNGCGMSPDEAVLCFERHATSKIASAQDLESISTYGFRGEALASIAAVSEVTLKTRRKEDETGTLVKASDSKVTSTEQVSAPIGTNFAIRNLFYNVPARRKFLKSDQVELRNIIQEFLRVALTRPEVTLKLTSNGKDLYNLKPARNTKQRIHDVFGMNMANELVEVKVDTSVVNVRGYIGNPGDAHKRLGNQFFFVNGRYFRSPFFHKAVCKPYEKLIPEGHTPAYFIFLETDPDKIDVNIHPAKTEIKFEDEGTVFEILMAAVRESLSKNDFTPSIIFDMAGAPEFPPVHPSEAGRTFSMPKIDYDPLFNPFDASAFATDPGSRVEFDTHTEAREFFDSNSAVPSGKLLVLHGRYIVTPVKSGMMVVDVRRARQRILYEKYFEKMVERESVSQQTLFPVTVSLSTEDYIALLEQPDYLNSLGFDIRDFGNNTVVVYGVPEGYSLDEAAVKDSVDSLIAIIKDDCPSDDENMVIAAKMAESATRNAAGPSSTEEAQLLVDQLFACREPGIAPSGSRTTTIITYEDLEKKL